MQNVLTSAASGRNPALLTASGERVAVPKSQQLLLTCAACGACEMRELPLLLAIDEFSQMFGPGRTQTYELLKRREIEGRKIGRRSYIVTTSALRWMASLPSFLPRIEGNPLHNQARSATSNGSCNSVPHGKGRES